MLSNTECKKILNRNGRTYTDEEIEKLKETAYKMAEIMWRFRKELNEILNSKTGNLK